MFISGIYKIINVADTIYLQRGNILGGNIQYPGKKGFLVEN
jgi:hypothetical protein